MNAGPGIPREAGLKIEADTSVVFDKGRQEWATLGCDGAARHLEHDSAEAAPDFECVAADFRSGTEASETDRYNDAGCTKIDDSQLLVRTVAKPGLLALGRDLAIVGQVAPHLEAIAMLSQSLEVAMVDAAQNGLSVPAPQKRVHHGRKSRHSAGIQGLHSAMTSSIHTSGKPLARKARKVRCTYSKSAV
jgi:hypothetical protein